MGVDAKYGTLDMVCHMLCYSVLTGFSQPRNLRDY